MSNPIKLPADIGAVFVSVGNWLLARVSDPDSAHLTLGYLGVQRALAPKTWRIGRPPANGVYDVRRDLPLFPLEDVPYSLDSIQWALNTHSEPRAGNYLYASFNEAKKLISPQYTYADGPIALSSLATELFLYPKYVDVTEKPKFDQFLATATSPELGHAIMLSVTESNIELDYTTVPTPLSEKPGNVDLSLLDVFSIAFFSRIPLMKPLINTTGQDKFFERSSFALAKILKDHGGVNLDHEMFFQAEENAFKFWTTDFAVNSVLGNIEVFRPFSELVYLFNERTYGETVFQQIITNFPSPDLQKVEWLNRQFNDDWASYIWVQGHFWIAGTIPKHILTMEALEAIYSVGAQWYKFEPQLQLYLYPEQAGIVGSFWDTYGESILLLQDLAQAYQDWSTNKDVDKNKICPPLVGRLVDTNNVERLRRPLLELQQKAIVQDVPLRFLFDTQLPILKPSAGSLESILADYDSQIRQSLSSLRSSLWWFDTLRVWWDVVCKDYLHQKLGEIIQMDSGLEGQEQQINNIVSEALIHYTQKSRPLRKRLNGMKVINSSKLSAWMKQEAKRRFDAILADPAAVSEIQQLDMLVQTGQLPASFARSDLEDLIKRFI